MLTSSAATASLRLRCGDHRYAVLLVAIMRDEATHSWMLSGRAVLDSVAWAARWGLGAGCSPTWRLHECRKAAAHPCACQGSTEVKLAFEGCKQ